MPQGIPDYPDLENLLARVIEAEGRGATDEVARLVQQAPPNARRELEEALAWHREASSALTGLKAGPSRMLGGFRLLKELGRGGMATVHLAEEVGLGRLVALKVLDRAADPDSLARFKTEARACAALRHPGIVSLLSFGEIEGRPYLAMEFVRGAPLSKILEKLRGRRLSSTTGTLGDESRFAVVQPLVRWWGSAEYFDEVARLLSVVADAAEHAHRNGVLHRDLKPSNILLADRGSPVICDFGLARFQTEPGKTGKWDILGTLEYASPEQVLGPAERVDARTDVFSLGATLYELLTLVRPFGGENAAATVAAVVTKAVVSPRKRNPRIPKDLESICLKALEKDPARRYPSAEAFAADLRSFLARRPILARPAGLGEQIVLAVRRRPARAAAGVLAAALLLGAGLVIAERAGSQAGEAQAEAEDAAERAWLAAGRGAWEEAAAKVALAASKAEKGSDPQRIAASLVLIAEMADREGFVAIASRTAAWLIRESSDRDVVARAWLVMGEARFQFHDLAGAEEAWRSGLAADPREGSVRQRLESGLALARDFAPGFGLLEFEEGEDPVLIRAASRPGGGGASAPLVAEAFREKATGPVKDRGIKLGVSLTRLVLDDSRELRREELGFLRGFDSVTWCMALGGTTGSARLLVASADTTPESTGLAIAEPTGSGQAMRIDWSWQGSVHSEPAIGDLDGDADPDLAAIAMLGGKASVLLVIEDFDSDARRIRRFWLDPKDSNRPEIREVPLDPSGESPAEDLVDVAIGRDRTLYVSTRSHSFMGIARLRLGPDGPPTVEAQSRMGVMGPLFSFRQNRAGVVVDRLLFGLSTTQYRPFLHADKTVGAQLNRHGFGCLPADLGGHPDWLDAVPNVRTRMIDLSAVLEPYEPSDRWALASLTERRRDAPPNSPSTKGAILLDLFGSELGGHRFPITRPSVCAVELDGDLSSEVITEWGWPADGTVLTLGAVSPRGSTRPVGHRFPRAWGRPLGRKTESEEREEEGVALAEWLRGADPAGIWLARLEGIVPVLDGTDATTAGPEPEGSNAPPWCTEAADLDGPTWKTAFESPTREGEEIEIGWKGGAVWSFEKNGASPLGRPFDRPPSSAGGCVRTEAFPGGRPGSSERFSSLGSTERRWDGIRRLDSNVRVLFVQLPFAGGLEVGFEEGDTKESKRVGIVLRHERDPAVGAGDSFGVRLDLPEPAPWNNTKVALLDGDPTRAFTIGEWLDVQMRIDPGAGRGCVRIVRSAQEPQSNTLYHGHIQGLPSLAELKGKYFAYLRFGWTVAEGKDSTTTASLCLSRFSIAHDERHR